MGPLRRVPSGYSGQVQGGPRAAKPSAGLHSHSSVKGSAGVSFVQKARDVGPPFSAAYAPTFCR
jgi:hypothetical protein